MIRNVNEILQTVIPDLFERSRSEAAADSVEAAKRELPKICELLNLDIATMKPKENPERNLTKRMATDKASLYKAVGL